MQENIQDNIQDLHAPLPRQNPFDANHGKKMRRSAEANRRCAFYEVLRFALGKMVALLSLNRYNVHKKETGLEPVSVSVG